jgi:hypothetical protein
MMLLPCMSAFSVSLIPEHRCEISTGSHHRLFIFDMLNFIFGYRMIFHCWDREEMTPMFFLYVFGIQFSIFTSCLNVCRHFIYSSQPDGPNSSLAAMKPAFLSQMVLFGLEGIANLALVIAIIWTWQPVTLIVTAVFYMLVRLMMAEQEYIRFSDWEKTRKPLDLLPDASSVDLLKGDLCIICRQAMTPENSKRLPCHHCMHVYCMAKWIGYQAKCPLCQTDLSLIAGSTSSPYFAAYKKTLRRVRSVSMESQRKRDWDAGELYCDLWENLHYLRVERQFLMEQRKLLAQWAGGGRERELEDNSHVLRKCDSLMTKHTRALRKVMVLMNLCLASSTI